MNRYLLIPPVLGILAFMSCGGGAEASLKEKLANSTEVTAKVVYRDTYEGMFEELNSTTVIAVRPPDQRVDITYDSGDTEVISLYRGDLVECRNGECAPVIEDRQTVLDRLEIFDPTRAIPEDAYAAAKVTASRVIAGSQAECFEAAESELVAEMCFAADSGVFLLLHAENLRRKLSVTIEAISVDLDVQIEDVAPPDG